MTGMVYKDFCVLRKQAAYYLLFLAVYAVLVATGAFPSSVLAGLVVVTGMMLPMSSFSYDDQARWDKYAASTPAGRGGVVGGKYLLAAAATLAASIVAFLTYLILFLLGISGSGMAEAAFVVLSCAAVTLVLNAVILPLLFKFGAEKSRVISMILFVGVFGVCIAAGPLLKNAALPAPPAWLLAALPGLLGLAAVGGFAVSYFVSRGIYEKKEL